MPNWCECDLHVTGTKERIEEFLKHAKGEEGDFDFNRFVPMPRELSEVPSGSDEIGYRAKYGTEAEVAAILSYPWVRSEGITTREGLLTLLERTKPEMMALADRYKENVEKHGTTSWYDWCCEHWGTKWNARSAQLGELECWGDETTIEINFDTAWSPPLPVIQRAAELFPDLSFELRYFECGAGYNGMLLCEKGEVTHDESGNYYGNRGG